MPGGIPYPGGIMSGGNMSGGDNGRTPLNQDVAVVNVTSTPDGPVDRYTYCRPCFPRLRYSRVCNCLPAELQYCAKVLKRVCKHVYFVTPLASRNS